MQISDIQNAELYKDAISLIFLTNPTYEEAIQLAKINLSDIEQLHIEHGHKDDLFSVISTYKDYYLKGYKTLIPDYCREAYDSYMRWTAVATLKLQGY